MSRHPAIDLERSLRALADEVFPEAPPLAPAVAERLRAGQVMPGARGERRRRRWSRRRLVVLAAAAILLLLAATAVATRLGIGAIGVRIDPSPTASGSAAPETGAAFGRRIDLAEAREAVRFRIGLPDDLPLPDRVWLEDDPFGDRVAMAWRADRSAGLPGIPWTPWGLVLLETDATGEVGVKELVPSGLGGTAEIRSVSIGGAEGLWIDEPHDLVIRIPGGERRLRVTGAVLLWHADGVTYRLETSLALEDALSLARSMPRGGTSRAPAV